GRDAVVQSLSADGKTALVTAPAGEAGLAAVEVVNPGGLSAIAYGAYRYLVPPHIDSATPLQAPIGSRQIVTIRGTGFFPGSRVLFGGTPARSVALDSSGSLSVVVPDDVIGPVSLSVGTPTATSPATDVFASQFPFTLR